MNSKKKVGLLTFHDEPNYGAFLQTYALSECVKKMGYEVEVIDLRIKDIIKYSFLVKLFSPIIRFFIFEKARKRYLKRSKLKYYSSKELSEYIPECDIYLLGSDQVWNKDITTELKYAYFFDFLPVQFPRLAYASSFGVEKWDFDEQESEKVKDLLGRFRAIGVREKSAIKLCEENCNIKSTLVVDPTLLLSNYKKLTGLVKAKEGRVVCFKFTQGNKFYEFLNEFKNISKFEISILGKTAPLKGILNIPLPTIKKWVKSIAESELVITDSYHALIFSIIYRKKFIVLPANEKNFNRLAELLRDLDLEERIYKSYEEVLSNDKWKNEIDYDAVEDKLQKKVEFSLEFLKRELKNNCE